MHRETTGVLLGALLGGLIVFSLGTLALAPKGDTYRLMHHTKERVEIVDYNLDPLTCIELQKENGDNYSCEKED